MGLEVSPEPWDTDSILPAQCFKDPAEVATAVQV